MLWSHLVDLYSTECGLILWCLFIGYKQYLCTVYNLFITVYFLQELDIYNFEV